MRSFVAEMKEWSEERIGDDKDKDGKRVYTLMAVLEYGSQTLIVNSRKPP